MGVHLLSGRKPPVRGLTGIFSTYRAHPWLHMAVRRRADAVGAVEWEIYRTKGGAPVRRIRGASSGFAERQSALESALKAGEVERLPDHEFLKLLRRPNPVIKTRRAMLSLLSMWLDLGGEGFVVLERGRDGRLASMWPTPPTWVYATPSRERMAFEIRKPGSRPELADPSDVCWLRHLDPSDPYTGRGVGTGLALADEIETDEYAAATAKARYFNRMTPDVLVGIQGAPPEELERMAEDFARKHGGPERAGRAHFMNGDFRAQVLAHTMKEAQYTETRRMGRDFVFQGYGMPPEVVGILENANRSTIDASEYLFAKLSTVPTLELIRSELAEILEAEFGSGLWLEYVSPVPADEERRAGFMKALPGAFRLNEIRAAAGEEPLEDERGDELLVAPGAANVPTPGETATEVEPASSGAGAPEGSEDDEDEDEPVRLALAGSLGALRA